MAKNFYVLNSSLTNAIARGYFEIIDGLFLLFNVSCSSLLHKLVKEPKVEIDHVEIQDPDLQGATLLFFLKVENPNDFEIKVDQVAYKVFIDDKLLTTTHTSEPLKVAAKAQGLVSLPLPVKYGTLWAGLSSFFSSRKLSYRVEGDAKLSALSVPFKTEGLLNLDEMLKK